MNPKPKSKINSYKIVDPDGRTLIRSKGSLNKNRRRTKGAPPAESNNRREKRAEMSDAPYNGYETAQRIRTQRNNARIRRMS